MERLFRTLLAMLRYARDRLLELRDGAPTETPEELLNSGIGVLTRVDESVHNPDSSLHNPSNSPQQLQKDKCTAELRRPTIARSNDLGMNHCFQGGHDQAENEKAEEIHGRESDVNIKLQGILSKLEVSQDYDSLARQVRQEGVTTLETLRGVTSLIFENAATHPAQCPMYAQLCVLLSKLELPNFPGDKTITTTFQSVLQNTCQEEFVKLTKPEQQAVKRDDSEKEKRVKILRKLGNVQLIGELYNVKLLPEQIVHACVHELLGLDPKTVPAEENLEVLCHLFTTVGKKLEESTKSKVVVDAYFARLTVIRKSSALPSRILNMVRRVFDMRSTKWMSPQEVMEMKKINKIRAKAVKSGQRPETMEHRKRRPAAATPKLLQLPGVGGVVPAGMSVAPSILGMPAMPGMPGGGGPVQLVDERRKASMDKEILLRVPVASGVVKRMEFGAGRVAAMPRPRMPDDFGVRANKDKFNLRDLSQRVQKFDE